MDINALKELDSDDLYTLIYLVERYKEELTKSVVNSGFHALAVSELDSATALIAKLQAAQ